jgi:hypothetical protein
MSQITRILAAVVTVLVAALVLRAGPAAQWIPAAASLSEPQRELVEWATGRFEHAGLDLPQVEYVFHDDLMPCGGRVGLYHASQRLLEMCRLDRPTVLHELAHAWANAHLDDATRRAFMATRGLDVWHGGDVPWEQRATEHAAEIIAWALLDRNRLVRWVEPAADGSDVVTWRLLSLPGGDVDALVAGYRLLTGLEPAWRLADDPRLETATATGTTPVRHTGG